MRTFAVLAAVGLSSALAAGYNLQAPLVPDPKLSPGDVLTSDPKIVCVSGFPVGAAQAQRKAWRWRGGLAGECRPVSCLPAVACGMLSLKPALLLVSALLLGACNQASGGVPGALWERSLVYFDAQTHDDSGPRLSCDGGFIYELTPADVHLSGRVLSGELSTTAVGSFRRGAAYTLEVGCLGGDLRETAHTSLSTTVPVNGTLNWYGREPEENYYQVTVMFRQDLSKPQSFSQKCSGSSQGTRAPCISVSF